MANSIFLQRHPFFPGVFEVPESRGVWDQQDFTVISRQALPTDPIGITTVTFSGVVADSEIRIMLSDNTEIAGIEFCAANQQLSWNVYAAGSPNNSVRIHIVHPEYEILAIDYTSTIGAVAIPIQQRPDKWYSNPT